MAVVLEYRTCNIELMNGEFWYEGDNESTYESVADAQLRSDFIADWQSGTPSDLTSVRVRDLTTGKLTYISPWK